MWREASCLTPSVLADLQSPVRHGTPVTVAAAGLQIQPNWKFFKKSVDKVTIKLQIAGADLVVVREWAPALIFASDVIELIKNDAGSKKNGRL